MLFWVGAIGSIVLMLALASWANNALIRENKVAVESACKKMDHVVAGKYYNGKNVQNSYMLQFSLTPDMKAARGRLLLKLNTDEWGLLLVEVAYRRIVRSKLFIIPESEARELASENLELYRQIFGPGIVGDQGGHYMRSFN